MRSAGAEIPAASSAYKLSVREKTLWLDWMPEIALCIATLLALRIAAARWLDPMGDPGIWWSTVYRLSTGDLLYRDVYLQFGPLSPYLLSMGARLFGASGAYMLHANWIPALAASFLLLRIAKPLLSPLERFAVAGLLLSESLLAPGVGRLVYPYAPGAAHALLFSMVAILLAARSAGRPTWILLAGCSAGLATCAKQEIGLACLLALLAAAPLRPGAVRRAAHVLVGFGVVALPAMVAVFWSAPIESLRARSHLWPVALLPPPEWSHLYRQVAGVALLRWEKIVFGWAWKGLWCAVGAATIGLVLAREKRPSRWFSTLVTAGGLCLAWQSLPAWAGFRPSALTMTAAIIAGLLVLTLPKFEGAETAFALAVFAALIGARSAFSTERTGPYWGVTHFASAFTWVLLLCLLLPRVVPGGSASALWTRRVWGVALLIVSAFGGLGGARALVNSKKEILETPRGAIAVAREVAPFLAAVGAHVRPGDRIWVLPEINAVDALFQARSVSPYPSHLPGWLNAEDEADLVRRIDKNRPDVVIVFTRTTKEYGVAPFGAGYDRLLAEWVDRHYAPIVEMPAGRIFRVRDASVPAIAFDREP